jgi:hypothetical protein
MSAKNVQSTKALLESMVSTIFFSAAYVEIGFSCSREVRVRGRPR